MHIQARHRLALEVQCPHCKRHSAFLDLSRSKRNRTRTGWCFDCDCEMTVIQRRYYTVFASDFYDTAGTLGELGPFTVCTLVFPTIRVFRRVVAEKQAQREQEARVYWEHEQQAQAAYEARLAQQRAEAALLQEAERIAYHQAHRVELLAEDIAQSVWSQDASKPLEYQEGEPLDLNDEHPF